MLELQCHDGLKKTKKRKYSKIRYQYTGMANKLKFKLNCWGKLFFNF